MFDLIAVVTSALLELAPSWCVSGTPTLVTGGILSKQLLRGQLIHRCTFLQNDCFRMSKTRALNGSCILNHGFYSQIFYSSTPRMTDPTLPATVAEYDHHYPDIQTIPKHVIESPVIAQVCQSPQFCDALSSLTNAAVKLEPLNHYSHLWTIVLLHDQLGVCLVSWLVRGDQTSQQFVCRSTDLGKQAGHPSRLGLNDAHIKEVPHAL